MNLTDTQLNRLRIDLQQLAGIEYDEMITELLDHYAILTEEKMADGLTFEDASKWAWYDLGSGSGIQAIQTDYEKAVGRQIRQRHIGILVSYFGWPTAVSAILALVLIYVVTPLVTVKMMLGVLCAIGIAPTLIIGYGFRKHMDQQTDSRKLIWAYLQRSGSIVWHLVYLIVLNPLITDRKEDYSVWLFRLHSIVGVTLCWVALLYAVSFIQLFKESFDLKTPAIFAR